MKIYFSLSILGALALTSPLRAQDATKLLANSPAPQIITRDVGGSPVQVPNGKSGFVLLSFFRGSGCPICRLRFHELEEHADELKAHHVDSIAIYEDKEEFLRQYTRGVPSHTRLVADPEGNWYRSYGLEKSIWGMMKTLFNGGINKASAGKTLLAPVHGGSGGTRLTAEFLMNGAGNIIDAHYGTFVGDHLPIDTILRKTAANAR